MRRYGWDYDRGCRGWDRGPTRFYDRGYREGWGMTGLNNMILHGPRPEERGYDHAIHGRRGHPRYDDPFFRSRGRGYAPRPYGYSAWRGGYDRGWF